MEDSALFKDRFNAARVRALAESVSAVWPDFPRDAFEQHALQGLESLELKARVMQIAAALRATLPADYPEALSILLRTLPPPLPDAEDITRHGFDYWPHAQFIESYGLDHLQASVKGMYEVTRRFSAEFAIRPFLLKYPEQMDAVLREWVKDPDLHVRRLVSEGSRPRLPWGIRLPAGDAETLPYWHLLEALRDDPEAYVRRSVANHLNDLSKTHPELLLNRLNEWMRDADENRIRLIRHALRSLVKAGHPGALALLGYGESPIELHSLHLDPATLAVGETLSIQFELFNPGHSPQKVMLDYVIHHVKARGHSSPKVFKIGEKTLAAGGAIRLQKRHSFRLVTTRNYHSGLHRVEIQVNGQILAGADFLLEA